MTEVPQLRTTPVKEIIFTISFANNISLDCLEKFKSHESIKTIFPSSSPGFHTNLKASESDGAPVADIQKSGYILRCDPPCNRLIQAKRGQFSFHKTKEYEKYEILIRELNKYWALFQSCSTILNVTNASLRYVNFIRLDEGEDLNELIAINVSHPYREEPSSFVQLRFPVSTNPKIEAKIVVSKGNDGKENGVLLDISLSRSFEKESFKAIEEAFQGMRDIKNQLFFDSITKKTKQKYQ